MFLNYFVTILSFCFSTLPLLYCDGALFVSLDLTGPLCRPRPGTGSLQLAEYWKITVAPLILCQSDWTLCQTLPIKAGWIWKSAANMSRSIPHSHECGAKSCVNKLTWNKTYFTIFISTWSWWSQLYSSIIPPSPLAEVWSARMMHDFIAKHVSFDASWCKALVKMSPE